ncbi:unnamed protein product [Closterium sp. NIES-53]
MLSPTLKPPYTPSQQRRRRSSITECQAHAKLTLKLSRNYGSGCGLVIVFWTKSFVLAASPRAASCLGGASCRKPDAPRCLRSAHRARPSSSCGCANSQSPPSARPWRFTSSCAL